MNKQYYDLFIELDMKEIKKLEDFSKKLQIKLPVLDFSALFTNDYRRVRRERGNYLVIGAMAKSNKEAVNLLTDTYYDFLIVYGFKLNRKVLRMARMYETPLVIPLFTFLRAKKLSMLSRNLEMLNHYGYIFSIASGAKSFSELRSGRDLAAIAILFGLYPDRANLAVSKWPREILERAEKRQRQVAWGVEIWD